MFSWGVTVQFCVSPFLRGVIFTRARVSLVVISLRKMGTTRSLAMG